MIEAAAGRGVDLAFHENRVSLASVRSDARGSWRVRLHSAFLAAPESVFQHLGMFLRTRKSSWWKTVRDFAGRLHGEGGAAVMAPAGPRPVRRTRIRSAGVHVDLLTLLAEVNAAEFGGRHAAVKITWGKAGEARRARRRSIRFGSFDPALNLIRIHPSLDDPGVPAAFMRYLVFHELLHAEYPPRRSGGRWIYHSREFKQRERLYPGLREMKDVMTRLMRAAP
ncbi:MAG: hypothetical protein U1F87_10420 [Kiritimatiellia bacterium]